MKTLLTLVASVLIVTTSAFARDSPSLLGPDVPDAWSHALASDSMSCEFSSPTTPQASNTDPWIVMETITVWAAWIQLAGCF
jgi:hypothetical protein